MKKFLIAIAALVFVSSSSFAERYVMVTHGEGKDPFWPVVQKGGEDAARAIGADFEYIYNPSADMADMASSIQAAAATQPDGMVISLPDPDALGPAIKAAVAAGVPVITMNSGLESSASLGALMHVGQPEYLAGQSAGARAKAEGATKALCMIQEAYNTALVDRCEGYGESVPMEFTDTTSDPATIQTRATAALQANPDVDAILSVGPHVCSAVALALDDLGMSVHHSCFDLSPDVMDLINAGKVAFTIDQQQRLQGYMPIIVLHLYNNGAGLLPGANIPSGPGFVDKSNASSVAALAGIVVVPLYFNPTTAALHEAFPTAYYAEPVLWAGFAAGLLQTLLQVIFWDKMGFRTIKDGALNGIWLGAILGGIQNLNEASQYAVFNATGQAFITVLIYIIFTAVSGGAIAWAFARGEKSEK